MLRTLFVSRVPADRALLGAVGNDLRHLHLSQPPDATVRRAKWQINRRVGKGPLKSHLWWRIVQCAGLAATISISDHDAWCNPPDQSIENGQLQAVGIAGIAVTSMRTTSWHTDNERHVVLHSPMLWDWEPRCFMVQNPADCALLDAVGVHFAISVSTSRQAQ
jgi:hypothetical protein